MDGSYDESVREVEEECGLLQGGVRFRQEKTQRTKESHVATETRSYETRSQGTKQPYSDKRDD